MREFGALHAESELKVLASGVFEKFGIQPGSNLHATEPNRSLRSNHLQAVLVGKIGCNLHPDDPLDRSRIVNAPLRNSRKSSREQKRKNQKMPEESELPNVHVDGDAMMR
jgi:hypothetical protein